MFSEACLYTLTVSPLMSRVPDSAICGSRFGVLPPDGLCSKTILSSVRRLSYSVRTVPPSTERLDFSNPFGRLPTV